MVCVMNLPTATPYSGKVCCVILICTLLLLCDWEGVIWLVHLGGRDTIVDDLCFCAGRHCLVRQTYTFHEAHC